MPEQIGEDDIELEQKEKASPEDILEHETPEDDDSVHQVIDTKIIQEGLPSKT